MGCLLFNALFVISDSGRETAITTYYCSYYINIICFKFFVIGPIENLLKFFYYLRKADATEKVFKFSKINM